MGHYKLPRTSILVWREPCQIRLEKRCKSRWMINFKTKGWLS